MGAMAALARVDVKNVSRDSLTRFLIAYPFLLGLLFRYLVPLVDQRLEATFDLTPYYPLIVGFFGILITSSLAGYVIGFLLLDERDDHTLLALRVTPLTMQRYLTYRLLTPVLIGLAAAFIAIPLMDLMELPYLKLLPITLVAALMAPIFALLLAALASNKVQGFAVMKGLGLLFLAPFAAWFIAEPWQFLLGLFPTYWPVKAFWVMLDGGNWGWFLLAGVVVSFVWIGVLLRRFERVAFR